MAAGLDASFAAYLTFTAILVVTPGATTAVVVRNTLRGGRHAGLASALGAAVANCTHATLAGLGLSVLLIRWPALLAAIRAIGAAYLAWLGLVSVWTALRFADGGLSFGHARHDTSPAPDGTPTRLGDGSGEVAPMATLVGADIRGFREGVAVNLANPAIISFYVAIVPSFMPADAARFYFVVLAASHVSMALVCHSTWALALHAARRWFSPPLARRALTMATGLALLFLAVRVLV